MKSLLPLVMAAAAIAAPQESRLYTNRDLESVSGNLTFNVKTCVAKVSLPPRSKPRSEIARLRKSYRKLLCKREELAEAIRSLGEELSRSQDAFYIIRSHSKPPRAASLRKELRELRKRRRRIEEKIVRIERRAHRLGVSTIGLLRGP